MQCRSDEGVSAPHPPPKAAIFTPRLIVFNETFAPLVKKGARSEKEKPLAVLWHEAVAGRDAEDVAATFWRYLVEHRDKKVVTIYADNCAGAVLTSLGQSCNMMIFNQSCWLSEKSD